MWYGISNLPSTGPSGNRTVVENWVFVERKQYKKVISIGIGQEEIHAWKHGNCLYMDAYLYKFIYTLIL